MKSPGCILITLILLAAIVLGIAYLTSGVTFEGTVEKTVVDKGDTFFVIKSTSTGESEIFENEDYVFAGKFNSNDFLMNIDVGKTYDFKVIGWRIPLFSQYRNIIKYNPKN